MGVKPTPTNTAFRMSSSIAVMANGCVETIGTKKEVFADPKTRPGATLTGCKNISSIQRIDANTVYAPEWGIQLTIPNLKEDITSIGIRMRRIRQAPGENTFHCRVVSEIEDPFYYTMMLRPVDADEGMPIGWLLEKDIWLAMRSEEVDICLPIESILLLQD